MTNSTFRPSASLLAVRPVSPTVRNSPSISHRCVARRGLAALLAAAALCAPRSDAADPAAPREVSLDHPVDFIHGTVFRPVAPFELVPDRPASDWTFVFEPYLWALGLNGDVGLGRLPAAGVRASSHKVLQNLNWGLMARGEIRKGRWGLLADGLYADLEGSRGLGGNLYESGSLGISQGLASLALAYRVVDDRRGFVDVYAGARYNYVGMDLALNQSAAGIDNLSRNLTAAISSRVRQTADSLVDSFRSQAASALADAVTQRLTPELLAGAGRRLLSAAEVRVLDRVAGLERPSLRPPNLQPPNLRPPGPGDRNTPRLLGPGDDNNRRPGGGILPGPGGGSGNIVGRPPGRPSLDDVDLRRVLSAVLASETVASAVAGARPAIREYISAVAAARLAAAKGAVTEAVNARVAAAQQRLTAAISRSLEQRLPTEEAGRRAWIDPIIGLRAQLNLTRWLFLAAQGDAGGFGAGSQMAWTTQATVGVNFTRQIFAEAGYRYMYVDYDQSGFLYRMNYAGVFAGLGFKF